MRSASPVSWFKLLFSFLLVVGTQIPLVANARVLTPADSSDRAFCEAHASLCVDPANLYTYDGTYIGHDEPSILFYSNTAGAGNSENYNLTIPKDPPTAPRYNGGGTDNFELHPAFWIGMALCDNQSAPEATTVCTPDSDANIFNSSNPSDPNYIGNHPGGAYMELQFYPPGWVLWPAGNSCDATKWCAALNIDSFLENQNTGVFNNTTCENTVGDEPVNFAYITLSGAAQAPANPVSAVTNPAVFTPDPTKDLFMSSGDVLNVDLRDTANGLHITIRDVTSGQTGSMTAGTANGFGQIKYDPNGSGCTVIPNNFHPMYSTASEATRLTWTAHSYNIAASDEVGHFEFCKAVDAFGNCTVGAGSDGSAVDSDDTYCFAPPNLPPGTGVQLGGCYNLPNGDLDFDGPAYLLDWAGTATNPKVDAALHATPFRFSSPTFNNLSGHYSRVGFETDLARVEQDLSVNPCDPTTGANCVVPPTGAAFYPIYTTRGTGTGCQWQLGGTNIPGTTNTFGGTSTAEYGPLLQLFFPEVGGVLFKYDDNRQVLSSNPC
jgi:hypothetical protein